MLMIFLYSAVSSFEDYYVFAIRKETCSELKLSLNLKIQWLQSSIKTVATFVKFKLPLSKISTFLDTIAIEMSNNIKFKALF